MTRAIVSGPSSCSPSATACSMRGMASASWSAACAASAWCMRRIIRSTTCWLVSAVGGPLRARAGQGQPRNQVLTRSSTTPASHRVRVPRLAMLRPPSVSGVAVLQPSGPWPLPCAWRGTRAGVMPLAHAATPGCEALGDASTSYQAAEDLAPDRADDPAVSWASLSIWALAGFVQQTVAYLGAADNVSRLGPSPLSAVKQLAIRSRNPFSRPHPARLACLALQERLAGFFHIPSD